MPSRPINQQATSGPASELQSVVCTAEQVESCQQPFIHESNATGGQKRKQQRTVTNLFHPGYHLFEKPSSGRQNPVLKDQDHLPSQNNLAKSCHLTDTQPSKDSPSNPHDPASWPCYSHSLLCATNHHHFCKRPRITYCSAYHSPPGDMVTEC